MRITYLIIVLFLSNMLLAQDPDIPDYRSKRDVFKRITEKDIRADIASFSMGGIEESLGKSTLRSVPVTSYSTDSITFASDSIQVIIKGGVFEPSKHKLGYFDEKHLVKIDNRPFFGNYGKMPKTTIQSVTAIIGEDTVSLPSAAFNDLFNPQFVFNERGIQKSQNKVLVSKDGRKIYIYMLKPESGGSYEVTWVIQDKKYLKRVVDFGFLK